MTDLHALIHRMADELDHYRQLLTDNRIERHPLATEARAALAEPEPEGPTDEELRELWQDSWDTSEEHGAFQFARAVLARWGDGPAVSDDSEPASIEDQLKRQLFNKAKADLIREVINQALHDTASVHWRVADTGEQIVRVGDLLRWTEQAAAQMEDVE